MNAHLLRSTVRNAALTLALLSPALARADEPFSEHFDLDAQAYLGKWYELARTPNDFEDNEPTQDGKQLGPCQNSTATYDLIAEDRISILNQCERSAKDGSGAVAESIEGVGVIQADSQNRKLKIAFGDAFSRFLMRLFTGGGADYWVYGVGPINESGQYEWALVSGPARDNIFILTRTASVSDEVKNEILDLARKEQLPVDALIYPTTP